MFKKMTKKKPDDIVIKINAEVQGDPQAARIFANELGKAIPDVIARVGQQLGRKMPFPVVTQKRPPIRQPQPRCVAQHKGGKRTPEGRGNERE